jgi:two-component system cell cycle sensor histidine kinase/response regulator CckA
MIEQILDIRNYSYSVYSLPLFLTSVAATIMGGYVLLKMHISHHGVKFFIFTSCLSLWYGSFGMALCSTNAALSLLWFKVGNTGVILIPITNYSFITTIIERRKKNRAFIRGAYLVSFLFILSTLFSNLLIKSVKPFFWGYFMQYRPFGFALVIFFGFVVFKIISILWTGYKDATTERTRKRMKGLLVAMVCGYFGGFDFIPAFGIPLYPIGYLPVLIFLSGMTYVVIRFQLIDITPQTAATQILKTMQGALIVVDIEGRMRVINNAACIMFGYREAEMLGKNLSALLKLPNELRDHELLLDHPIKDFQLSFTDAQGKQVDLSVSASVLPTSDNVPIAIVYVALDITRHKELEAALAKAKDNAENLVSKRTAKLSETVEDLRDEIRERKRMEHELKRASEEWRITFDSTKDLIIMLNNKFEVVKANRAVIEFFELSFQEILGKPIVDLCNYRDFLKETDFISAIKHTKKRTERELFLKEKGLWLVLAADPILDDEGQYSGAVFTVRDISDIKRAEEEQKRLQSQLMQIQKMDSIGRLTGSIAHDFNNVLSAILGYSELSLRRLPADHPLREHLKIIYESGERAATLTRQLLAFSRKQLLEMKAININKVIENMRKMLERVIGENITLDIKTQVQLKNVLADIGQLEQVLMNLVVNGRDAMPSGGNLTIKTAMLDITEEDSRYYGELKPGSYAVLSVTDTGQGMSQETQKLIFEPFFTTKPMGKGTGLGLATVYGIVKQHNGYIDVNSEIGQGTTFAIYLPITEKEVHTPLEQKNITFMEGTETILVVDDDPSVRKLIVNSLQPLGYKILEASGGEEALRISKAFDDNIDLLLTDVIMPEMDGKELSSILKTSRPMIKALFISGYTDDILADRGILEDGISFLQKPIAPTMLSTKVRQVLDDETNVPP